jgi:hypothetical protein
VEEPGPEEMEELKVRLEARNTHHKATV